MAGALASLQDLLRPPFWEFAAAALGLVVGSFANVCIYRIPLGQSVGFPPSRCPGCGAAIRPWDNVPVISYLLLRGRCRNCGSGISPRYPLVEAANAAAYWAVATIYGPTLAAAVAMALVTALLILSLIDLDHQILPDAITKPGIALGIVAALAIHRPWENGAVPSEGLIGGTYWWEAPSAALAGYGAFALIAWAGRQYYRREALGRGDWKLAAMVGAFTGFKGLMLTVFAGSLLGAAVGLTLVALRKASRTTPIPLGTFLGIAAIGVVLCGAPVWRWYVERGGF